MVIAVATQKGGTGKTTTSISLASGLARNYHKKVLLIDIDSQANSSKVLLPDYQSLSREDTICATLLDRNPLPVRRSSVPNLDIVPSHILLSNTDVELTTAKDHREARLKNELDKIKDQYDYIFIDCPPALGWLTINAFTASDSVLAVVEPGYFELESIGQLNKTLSEVREFFHNELRMLGYLFTKADSTVNSRSSLKLLRQTYTDQVMETIIPRNVALKDASFNKQDIFAFSPNSKGALAYQRLIKELFYA
ncbi:MAG: ParA family protein [Chloroflexi bacterium]|jgi:chromosome partitioning protein|nr:ParA family protein [Chloroflexota bacterium]MBT4305007.1 ParA family protein [Chloroflexota bacterium]MBT4683714.1 ParA family protein [Chloroflexota bacterium]MBT6988062.1 ParA family protein [Chloroflexota bacterium]